MWNKDELKGKGDQIKGRLKEEVGDMNDDDRMRDEGAADRASGNIQEGFGKGRRKIGEAIEDLGENLKR
jgi:uncharacterized protein YjbJ (UPF0337 family)